MDWIYLSPHFDDVALSCGGLVWEQTQTDEQVSIWTLCAGDTPSGALSPFAEELHTRWETEPTATSQRRAEDLASCQILGASTRYFPIPDCVYRQANEDGSFLYASEHALTGPLQPAEEALIERLRAQLDGETPSQAAVVCPLALGNHVDHQLTRAAAERLKRRLWYYADYPYVLKHSNQLAALSQQGWKSKYFSVSEQALSAWQASVAAHVSQISTFWPDLAAMRAAVQAYCLQNEGVRLWQRG